MEAILVVLSVLCTGLQLVALCVLGCGIREYVRVKRAVQIFTRRVNMDCDALLAQLVDEEPQAQASDVPVSNSAPDTNGGACDIDKKRARLAALRNCTPAMRLVVSVLPCPNPWAHPFYA